MICVHGNKIENIMVIISYELINFSRFLAIDGFASGEVPGGHLEFIHFRSTSSAQEKL